MLGKRLAVRANLDTIAVSSFPGPGRTAGRVPPARPSSQHIGGHRVTGGSVGQSPATEQCYRILLSPTVNFQVKESRTAYCDICFGCQVMAPHP